MNDAIDASIPRQKQKWKRGKVHRLGDMIPVITHQGVFLFFPTKTKIPKSKEFS